MFERLRKRWRWYAAGALLLTGGLVWWLLGRPGAPSDVATVLPAEELTAALFIDDPADLLVALEHRFAAGERGVLDLDQVIEDTEFDPRVAETWAQIGVDEGAGVAVVLYGPTGPSPILLLDIADERLFYSWLNLLFDQDGVVPVGDGGRQELNFGRTQLFLGRRGRYTAIMRGGPNYKAPFEQFLDARGGRLLTERSALKAFMNAASRPRMVAYARTGSIARLLGFEGAGAQMAIASLLDVTAPTISGFLDDEGGAVRINTSEQGQRLLTAWVESKVPAPVFSRVLPEGWSALRLSFNVEQLGIALGAWLGSLGTPTDQPGWWPYVQGLQTVLERMSAVLSGHVVIAASNESLSTWLAHPDGSVPDWIVFAHLTGDPTPEQLAGLPAATRRIDQILAFGASPDLLAALTPLAADVDPPPANLILDGDVIFGLTVEASELMGAVEGAIPASVFSLVKSSELARKSRLAVGFARDEAGIVSRGDAGALLATAGLAGLIVAPELSQRRRERRLQEARTFVRRIADGAVAAWRRSHVEAHARRFPASVASTPVEAVQANCDGYPSQPRAWDDPGWKALGFGIFGEHRYQYAFHADARSFTARAVGDLDCDGQPSTFEVTGQVRGGEVVLDSRVVQPLE